MLSIIDNNQSPYHIKQYAVNTVLCHADTILNQSNRNLRSNQVTEISLVGNKACFDNNKTG